jgi:serine/threonine protein kinase
MDREAATASLTCSGCRTQLRQHAAVGLCPSCLNERLPRLLSYAMEGLRSRTSECLPSRFEYVGELGRGGMGVVYLAFERKLDRYVAFKQLGPAWREHRKAAERFLQEARAAARLSHPNIVRVFEVGNDEGEVWYTMEFVEGGDLATLLKRRGALPWPEAVHIISQLCSALDHAHRAGVAHRDIKPSNILIDSDGMAKLTDFGLAWVTGQELKELTATGELLGTPAYMAPEAINGRQRETDAQLGDLYSIGALLYHCIAGRPPFAASHPVQLLSSIATREAPPLVAFDGQQQPPWQLVEVCSRCLSKRPQNRYRSASELAIALKEASSRSSSVSKYLSYVQRRGKKAVLITAATLIAAATIAHFLLPAVNQQTGTAEKSAKYSVVTVLPLTAGTDDDTTKLLAQGLQDELITSLTRLTDLRVTGAASAKQVSSKTESPQEMRRLLGTDAVLIAKVQKWQEMYRVSVQLVDAFDGTVLWSQAYDRRETNLLDLQMDVSTDIALRLGAAMRPDSRDVSRGTTSQSPEAQQLVMHARRLTNDASDPVGALREAQHFLERATALDPSYGLAWARLSGVHTLQYHWGSDRSERRLELGLRAAQAALQTNDKLAEAHAALGNYYFRGAQNYQLARKHFDAALTLSPNLGEAVEGYAYLLRREGDVKAAAVHLLRAQSLDPLNPILAYNTADTCLRLGQFEKALEIIDRAVQYAGDHIALKKLRGEVHLSWHGDTRVMKEELAARKVNTPTPEMYVLHKIDLHLHEGDPISALAALRESDFRVLDAQAIFRTRDGFEALLLQLAGDSHAASQAAERSLPTLRSQLQRRPDDPRVLLHAGQIYTILGRPEGLQLALRTVTAGDKACVDAFDRVYYLRDLCVLFGAAGNIEKAKELLKELVQLPSPYTKQRLRRHAGFESLRHELN